MAGIIQDQDALNAQVQRAAKEGTLSAESLADLLAAGADINAKDNHDSTALHFAAWKGHVAVVQALLAAGAEINAEGCLGYAALHMAVFCRHFDVMAFLLAQEGVDINAKYSGGWTALHTAAGAGQVDVAHVLLVSGAEFEVEDNYHRTPLDIARQFQRDATVKIFERFAHFAGSDREAWMIAALTRATGVAEPVEAAPAPTALLFCMLSDGIRVTIPPAESSHQVASEYAGMVAGFL